MSYTKVSYPEIKCANFDICGVIFKPNRKNKFSCSIKCGKSVYQRTHPETFRNGAKKYAQSDKGKATAKKWISNNRSKVNSYSRKFNKMVRVKETKILNEATKDMTKQEIDDEKMEIRMKIDINIIWEKVKGQ